jgi:multiple sugar transport system substrate-binding protein
MNVRHRSLYLVLMVLLLLSVVPVNAQPVTITHMDFLGSDRKIAIDAIIKEFEKEYPNIHVVYETASSSTVLAEKFLTLMAAGMSPDVVGLHYNSMGDFSAKGYVRPLTPYIIRDQIDIDKLFVPGAFDMITQNGVIMGMPFIFNFRQMFVNRDMLGQAGLVEPKLGWTLSEFNIYAQKLVRVDSAGKMTQAIMRLPSNSMDAWLYVHGSTIFDDNTRELQINSEPFLKALDWQVDIAQRGLIDLTRKLTFIKGAVAFEPNHLGYVVDLTKDATFSWSSAYYPRGDIDTVTYAYTHPYVIPQASAHPEEAWTWLKYLTFSKAAAEYRAQYLVLPGTVEVNRLVMRKVAIPANATISQVWDPHMYPSSVVVRAPIDPKFQEAANTVNLYDVIARVIRGEKPARVAMAEITPIMEAIIR